MGFHIHEKLWIMQNIPLKSGVASPICPYLSLFQT